MSTDLEAEIGEFVHALDHRALTDEVLAPLRLAALDCLACILSGRWEAVSLKAIEHATRQGQVGPASIIGHAARVTVEGAALANGTMGHACDYDDVSLTMWGHATAPVLPAVLAIAEARDLSGQDLLLAFLAGLEVEVRLGAAAAPVHYESGWHPTSAVGVFGAAIGAAKALGLERDGIGNAIGIAASRAAGLRENFGTMTKPLHVGFAARDGAEAALLAAAGVTGARHALDGTYGFLAVLAPGHRSPDALPGRLGKPFDIAEPGLAYKMYPSCSDTHPSVDAALALRERHGIEPETIRRVRAGVTPIVDANLTYHDPKTPLEGKFSLEFCIAAALARGRLGLAEFQSGVVEDSLIQRLIASIEVWYDPELRREGELTFCSPASLEIETEDGQSFRAVETSARGHPDKPMSRAELEAKFAECAETVLDGDATARAIEIIGRLEAVASVRELTGALTPAAERARAQA